MTTSVADKLTPILKPKIEFKNHFLIRSTEIHNNKKTNYHVKLIEIN